MADVQSDRKFKMNKNGKIVKKRPRNPEEWHKQKQKRLRIAGLEYVNSNGKIVPQKQPGPDCNCRRKCFEKVPEEVRLKTFQGFYSMKTHDEQNAYLFGLMRQVDVKRKRVKSNSSRRTCTFEYFIRVKGRETQVCQTAFKNIHAITERKVRVLCKKMDDGIMFPSDNRGKNSHRRSGEVRLPNGVLDQIKGHIYSIVHTHRLKDFIRLDKITGLDINISKMWKDYIKSYDPDNVLAIMPKSKRPAEVDSPGNVQILSQPESQPAQTQEPTFASLYTTNGHPVNIAENYFQNQYQTNGLTTTTAPAGYYQTQNGPVILQQSSACPTQPTTAYIVTFQPKPEPEIITMAMPTAPSAPEQTEEPVKTEKKIKKEKRKGPLVKQWRYTNIFHDEINGAALAAIKTRLGMYYADSDAARKKTKQPRALESVAVQTQTPVQVQQQIAPTHTVTIYT